MTEQPQSRNKRLTAAAIAMTMAAACAPAPAPAPPPAPAVPQVRVEPSGPDLGRSDLSRPRPSRPEPVVDIAGEAARLRAALHREVPNVITDGPEAEQAWIARAQAATAASDLRLDDPQVLVVVDRNPRVQQLRLILAGPGLRWQSLGGTRVSTGQTGRWDYYLTPTGVFRHTDAILDWRAEGTFNAQHIRGLGLKGMRVWDFGWQSATKGWGDREQGEIRLLLHATDPANLERRIGRPASKGCIRIPGTMNRFLDRYGILDADYERAARDDPRFAALLLPDRNPTPLAGDALIVVDSAEPVSAAAEKAAAAHTERSARR